MSYSATRGSYARLVLKLVVSAGLLAFLFSKISLPDVINDIRDIDRRLAMLAVGVFFISNLIGAAQWYLLLRASGIELSFPVTFRFYFVGLFFNNFLPANIGGDAVKVYDVTRFGSSVYQVIAVTLLDRLIGIFSLCLLACVAVGSLINWYSLSSLAPYLLIFIGCMTPVLGFYFVEPLSKVLRRFVGMLKPFSLHQRGASILDYLGEFKARKALILRLIFLSLGIQALRVLTHVAVAASLGIHVTPPVAGLFFVFVPLLSLAMIPPITINGLGIREGLGILLFARADIGQTDAFTMEFLTYLVSVVVSLLGLVFFLLRREEASQAKADSTAI